MIVRSLFWYVDNNGVSVGLAEAFSFWKAQFWKKQNKKFHNKG